MGQLCYGLGLLWTVLVAAVLPAGGDCWRGQVSDVRPPVPLLLWMCHPRPHRALVPPCLPPRRASLRVCERPVDAIVGQLWWLLLPRV